MIQHDISERIEKLKIKVRYFKEKYNCTFSEFQEESKMEEIFERWDDEIDWKAAITELSILENKLVK